MVHAVVRSTSQCVLMAVVRELEMLRPIDATAVDYLIELVYELLDAHGDTTMLAGELVGDPRWSAHLDYLCGLQRVGRETLARLGS
jgi:hypothetical protein